MLIAAGLYLIQCIGELVTTCKAQGRKEHGHCMQLGK
jgi:hypothetical protein